MVETQLPGLIRCSNGQRIRGRRGGKRVPEWLTARPPLCGYLIVIGTNPPLLANAGRKKEVSGYHTIVDNAGRF